MIKTDKMNHTITTAGSIEDNKIGCEDTGTCRYSKIMFNGGMTHKFASAPNLHAGFFCFMHMAFDIRRIL